MIARCYAKSEDMESVRLGYDTGEDVTTLHEARNTDGSVQMDKKKHIVVESVEVPEIRGGFTMIKQGKFVNLYEIETSEDILNILRMNVLFTFLDA